jgi:hypothetical protein
MAISDRGIESDIASQDTQTKNGTNRQDSHHHVAVAQVSIPTQGNLALP